MGAELNGRGWPIPVWLRRATAYFSSFADHDASAARNDAALESIAYSTIARPLDVRVATRFLRSSRSTADFTRPSRSRLVISPDTVARVTSRAFTISLCGTPLAACEAPPSLLAAVQKEGEKVFAGIGVSCRGVR